MSLCKNIQETKCALPHFDVSYCNKSIVSNLRPIGAVCLFFLIFLVLYTNQLKLYICPRFRPLLRPLVYWLTPQKVANTVLKNQSILHAEFNWNSCIDLTMKAFHTDRQKGRVSFKFLLNNYEYCNGHCNKLI